MLERLIINLARAYTFHTPITRGRHRAYLAALSLCRNLPERSPARTRDGRRFSVNWKTGMQTTVFFLGEYEKAISDIVEKVVFPGDVCIDAGANFGWYTTLFRKLAGEWGEVHSFEPMPSTFHELEITRELMESPVNVYINNCAVGDKPGEMMIHLFEGEPTGHASLSDHGQANATSFACRVTTIDDYVKERNIQNVDFVKVDIEGAELMLLDGARRLFAQAEPPVMLIEMALKQTKGFGYLPNELIRWIREHADYLFFRADEEKGRLIEIQGFDDDDIGANVFCFPRAKRRDRFERVSRYL